MFGDSVFDDTRGNLAEVARPGGLSSAMGCLMFVGERSAAKECARRID